MFRTLNAKFPGTCKRCNRAFEAGAKIRYGGRGRTYHLKADCPASEPTTSQDTDTADDWVSDMPYIPKGEPERVSNEIVIGGKAFYRNKAGRCEDAPCCGCCTV